MLKLPSVRSVVAVAVTLGPLAAATQVQSDGTSRPQVRRGPVQVLSEEEETAQENARTHVLKSTRVPTRDEAIAAAKGGKVSHGALENALPSAAVLDPDAGKGPGLGRGPDSGKGPGLGRGPDYGKGGGPPGKGHDGSPPAPGKGHDSDAPFSGFPTAHKATWESGYLVDGNNPDMYTKNGTYALRLRTHSVLVSPGYTLRDMATRNVLRLKAGLTDQLLRLSINAPPPRTGNADAYLVTLGMAVGWNRPDTPPVALFLDGKALEYDITQYGIQFVKRMTPGPHHLTVHVEPGYEGDVFEFHYAMIHRLTN